MKSVIFVGCAALAIASGGVATAQAKACEQLTQLMAYKQPQVKALQGALVEEDKEKAEFTSKLQLAGFKDCTVEAGKTVDELTDYWEHHLSCSGEAESADAANQLVESLWGCTNELYSERHAVEGWIGGRYRVIGFEGETPTAGRAVGLVDFGTTDYARVVVEKAYDMSDEYRLNLYWSFHK